LHVVPAVPARRAPLYSRLYFQVLAGILVGAALGVLRPELGAAMKPFGDGFIKLIRMVIAPVIFTTVVSGIATMGDIRDLGRIGIKTLLYFEVITTPLALGIALILVNVIRPGAGINADPATLDASAVAVYAASAQELSTIDFILNIIPTTMVDAFARGEILQVLFVAVLVGLALLHLGDRAQPVVDAIEQISQVLFGIVRLIMRWSTSRKRCSSCSAPRRRRRSSRASWQSWNGLDARGGSWDSSCRPATR
jgi:aerobic C4-dicarboxylate transport protein